MNRIDRLTAIILLLQGGRRTASEIGRRFEVSKRTVFRDIEALCEMGVPIITESGPRGGYTLMPDYSLAPLQLTMREALLLRLALSSVSQLADGFSALPNRVMKWPALVEESSLLASNLVIPKPEGQVRLQPGAKRSPSKMLRKYKHAVRSALGAR